MRAPAGGTGGGLEHGGTCRSEWRERGREIRRARQAAKRDRAVRAWESDQTEARVLEALRPSRRAPLTSEERADPAIVAALARILLGDPKSL